MNESSYCQFGRRRCCFILGPWWLVLVCVAAGAAGCGRNAEVQHYKVPKPELVYAENHVDPVEKAPQQAAQQAAAPAAAQPAEPTDRMLGAIVPQGSQTWYFKLTGPKEPVARLESAFRQLIESLTFAGPDAPPQWKLPESWTQQPGSATRFATLVVEQDGRPLEVSVSKLQMDGSPDSILANVNRWRGQMGLPLIDLGDLADQTEALSLAGREVVLVNLVGTMSKSGGGPMMGIR